MADSSRHPRDARAHGDLAAVATLAEPTRRRVYEHVAAARAPVTRDDVSAACGVERSVAGYHLDHLVDAGLLTATYARREGRTGPGAGRPAKWYQRAAGDVSVTIPPRAYQLAAELLARTLDPGPSTEPVDAGDRAREPADAGEAAPEPAAALSRRLQEMAAAAGRDLAADHPPDAGTDAAVACLAACGFEPYDDGGVIRLGNCPFAELARGHAEVICAMNEALLAGVVEAVAADRRPAGDDDPATCCVALRPPEAGSQPGAG